MRRNSVFLGNPVQENNVTCQRTAREGPAWIQIGPRTNAWLTFQPTCHLMRVRASQFTKRCKFVDKGNRRCQESIEGVLCHFRRLHRHPLNSLAKWRKYLIYAVQGYPIAYADDNSRRLAKSIKSFSQP